LNILELYKKVYEDLLAVPVVKGKKTEKEKFPGGYYTTTVEAFVPTSGRGIQAATSHCLGQNFAKMFNIQFENDNKEKAFVWQNSWGLTTRSIGIMIMTHGDSKGLVLPPRVAPLQVAIVPIPFKDKNVNAEMFNKCKEFVVQLGQKKIRAQFDDRDTYTPGWKYNYWEMKGVPIRLEMGPKDFEKNMVVLVRRDTSAKEPVAWKDLETRVPALLEEIHNNLLETARKNREERLAKISKWEEFVPALDKRKIVLAAWCGEMACEDEVKNRSGKESKDKEKTEDKKDEEFEQLSGSAKSLCIPFDQPTLEEGTHCFQCGKIAKQYVLWGRSY